MFSANSIPRIFTAAVSNRLNPSIGLTTLLYSPVILLDRSITLFRYLQDRTCTRRGKIPEFLSLSTAR
jgi:hypothetical protein